MVGTQCYKRRHRNLLTNWQAAMAIRRNRATKRMASGRRGQYEAARVTPEQERRGVLGEEEIKRRLERVEGWQIRTSTGWATLTLLKDLRDTDCGFDFLCSLDGRDVEIEIKTFTANGYIHVTGGELTEAAMARDKYFILGVLYDNCPPCDWKTFLMQNPIDALREHGAFSLEPTVSVSPWELFNTPKEGD